LCEPGDVLIPDRIVFLASGSRALLSKTGYWPPHQIIHLLLFENVSEVFGAVEALFGGG